ncbi:barstar family protein [Pseudomonas alcaligenes]|uniref:barstar family protein n=1 Tax=Aquipseudomonas alcaligenes TaxID=43263 RepID=UPI002E7ACAF7|nr:barstar family protein [Pseudomonas alcaligenes]MEE1950174.1 barstar family protein [Pseudomonas alcaligenes]
MTRAQLVEIDLQAVTTTKELHSLLMVSLDFPGWYGHNWNAFWDAITGLVEMPQILKLSGWQELSQQLPNDAASLKRCLTEMQVQYPQFASEVVYA